MTIPPETLTHSDQSSTRGRPLDPEPSVDEERAAVEAFGAHLAEVEEYKRSSLNGLPQALETLTDVIRENWDTGTGKRLRQFVWSLWGFGHYVCLHQVQGLDPNIGKAVAVVFSAHVSGALKEGDLKPLLQNSGEFMRWEAERDLTPEHREVMYPPPPFSAETLEDLAVSAHAYESRERDNLHKMGMYL